MSRDPILNALGIALYRAVIFASGALVLTIVLWLWLILGWLDRPVAELPAFTVAIFHPEENRATTVVAGMCFGMACLIVTIVFLLADRWYRRPPVVRLRGARLVDTRAWRRRW